MKKWMSWLLSNVVFAGALVSGLVFDIEGARNLALFFAGLAIFTGLITVHPVVAQAV